ncbi:MAG: hypothetical protein KIT09_24330 [Bryobacteraceae bacterium]|nr:hypothetical protein [Bryobacteraceae bacterium]
MKLRAGVLLLLACSLAWPQQKVSVKDLVRFITSSIELKHSDREVANYLRNFALTERLDDRTIESLHGLGAGPRTLEALWKLRDASANLPAAEPYKEPPKAPTIPAPSPEEQKRIIEDVRSYALNYTKSLPDFICTQVTRRYVDPSGLEFWHKLDTVTAKVSYFEQKEDYKVILINNRIVDLTVDDLGGSTSTGEFGTLLREIFEPESEARFQWARWGKLRGRLAHVYDYRVRKDRSKWAISYEKRLSTVPGYTGQIYVDKDSPMVLRVTLQAEDIPPSFPIQEAGTTLDYDFADIAGHDFLLPMKFQMRMRQGKALVKNEVEFRLYRKFGADATITFDTPEPLSQELTTEEPATPPSQ